MLRSERFIAAARDDNLTIIQQYIAENRDNPDALNVTNQYGNTALSVAATKGHIIIVRTLLATSGTNVNATNRNGKTALIRTSDKGHIDVVRALLNAQHIDVNVTDRSSKTALIRAAIKGHTEIVAALLADARIDLTIQNKRHRIAAETAQQFDYRDIYRLMAPRVRAARVVDASFASAQRAARTGNLTVIRQYIAANRGNLAGINRTDEYSDTLLINAAMHGQTAVVNELMKLPELDVTACNRDHRTAAGEARRNGYISVAMLLEQDRIPAAAIAAASPHIVISSFEKRLKNIQFKNSDIPTAFKDHISHTIINDPVTLKTGITYDRKELKKHFRTHRHEAPILCPITRLPIDNNELNNHTNVTIKNLIEEFVKEQEEKYRQNKEESAVAASSQGASLLFFNKPHSHQNQTLLEAATSTRKMT